MVDLIQARTKDPPGSWSQRSQLQATLTVTRLATPPTTFQSCPRQCRAERREYPHSIRVCGSSPAFLLPRSRRCRFHRSSGPGLLLPPTPAQLTPLPSLLKCLLALLGRVSRPPFSTLTHRRQSACASWVLERTRGGRLQTHGPPGECRPAVASGRELEGRLA